MPNPALKTQNPPPSLEELKTRLQDFCRTRPIVRLEVFGSVARGEARPDSDVDLLVTFTSDIPSGFAYFGFVDDLEKELQEYLGCDVDLAQRPAVEKSINPLRRKYILEDAKDIYVAP